MNPITQRHFHGVDVFLPPADMGANSLRIMDNMIVVGGEARLRGGKIAKLTTAFSGPLYISEAYVKTDGSTALVLCSGGKLYQWNSGASTAQEILLNGVKNYTDLVIDGSLNTKVTSVSRPFVAGDVGLTLTITAGTGFTQGSYTVNSVSSGAATLSAAVGTLGSTGGSGVLGTSFNLITSQIAWVRDGKYMYIVDGAQTVTDLAIDASLNTKVTSASHVFRSADTGKHVQITGGTNFNLATFTISSVASGAATLSASAGTTSSTSGTALILGPLYRLNIYADNTYVAAAVTALTAPSIPTSNTLTSTVIDACTDPTKWSSFPTLQSVISGATSFETVLNGLTGTAGAASQYAGITSTDSDPSPDGWQKGGDSLDDGSVANRVYFDGGAGPSWIDWTTPAPQYATTLQTFTDLVIQSTTTQLRSATRIFRSTDVGALLLITSGTNFTTGLYRVASVANGTATMDRVVGTAAATGGRGIFSQADSPIRYGKVWIAKNLIYGYGQVDMQFFPEWSGNNSSGTYGTGYTVPSGGVNSGLVQVTDLVIDGTTNTKLTSVQRPFVLGDIGRAITITSGTGFNLGGHTIVGVTTGTATLALSAGTLSSTGGTGYLSFDTGANGTGGSVWGHQNYALQYPPSAVLTAYRDYPFKVIGNASLGTTQIVSFSTLATDAEEYRYRQYGQASNGPTGANTPSFSYVDVRLNVELAQNGTVHVKAQNVPGGHCLGNCYLRRDYSGTITTVTDMVIQSVSATQSVLSSVAYTFVSGDIGRYVAVLGASAAGYTVGNYVIASVSGGQATVTGIVGTASSTGGVAQVVSVKDYSTTNQIAIQFSVPATSGNIPFRLGFQAPGAHPSQSTGITWTNPVTQITDASGTYLAVDISTVATATRLTTQYLYLQIMSDLPADSNLSDLFTFGPITSAGNMTVGQSDYSYAATEVNDTRYTTAGVTTGVTTDGQVESDGSLPSVAVTPTGAKAQSVVIFAAPVNTSANYIYAYRYGGVFPSQDILPTARLIAKLPLWTDTLDAAYSPYVTWNHTTRTMIDNTPDLQLELTQPPTLATGRGNPPYGAQSVAIWSGRVGLADVSTIYLSWLLAADQSAGLYYNPIAPLPYDPYAAVKGGVYPAGSADNDTILMLTNYGAPLFAIKSRSTWALLGNDPTNFECREIFTKAGPNSSIGTVAARGWGQTADAIWFLGPNCVWGYDGSNVSANPVSVEIEPLIHPPLDGQPAISPTMMSGSAMCYHGQRMYLFMPTAAYNYTDLCQVAGDTALTQVYSVARPFLPTDVGKSLTFSANGVNGSPPNGTGGGFTAAAYAISSVTNGIATLASAPSSAFTTYGVASLPADSTNTVCHVYDSRQKGWTRFLNMKVTSASSLSAQADSDDLYMGGADGQLYQLSYAQYGDVLTVGGSATAIPWMVQSRGFGREGGDSSDFWKENLVQYMSAKYTLGEQAAITLSCGVVRKAFMDIHSLTRGPNAGIMNREDVVNQIRGDAAFVRISGSTKSQTIITAFAIELTKGTVNST